MSHDTIYALASGALPSGVAIIRVSGPAVVDVANNVLGRLPKPRFAHFGRLKHPNSGEVLDEGLALYFSAPNSFTGEDVLELHCHGGLASVEAVLAALSTISGLRMAEAGEFSRRAFENNRLDLTGLEGLSDLIAAQTQAQRRQALSQSSGQLRELYDDWRSQIIKFRALIEAELDFSDEDDVPGSVSDQVWSGVSTLREAIETHLADNRRGEITREGFRVALLGPPNAGKSSLLNALAQRDVAIVTTQAGTTRDTIEVSLRLGDHLVVVVDTAGLRDTDDVVEQEGIKRSYKAAREADLVLWLSPSDDPSDLPDDLEDTSSLVLNSKADLSTESDHLNVNTISNDGLDELLSILGEHLSQAFIQSSDAVPTRQRHRLLLTDASQSLENSLASNLEIELRSEHLRFAGDCIGKITGRIDVEDLLDVIFSEFCVGK